MSKRVVSAINVTPFIDVMLVLLVVFMITSPMMAPIIEVNLPSAVSSVDSVDEKSIVVTLSKMGNIYVSGEVVVVDDLAKKILELSAGNANVQVFISADKGVNYGHLVQVMDALRKVGIVRIGLITDD